MTLRGSYAIALTSRAAPLSRRSGRAYIERMDRPAALAPADAPPSRAKWAALGLAAVLLGLAAALWARYGAAVFIDALGLVASCF